MPTAGMADMAYTKDELKERKKSHCVGADGQPNPYPWGLAISLEKEQLEKLGVKQLPEVGLEVHFVAVGKVTSVNQSASEGREAEKRVGLQITQMQLVAAAPAEGAKE